MIIENYAHLDETIRICFEELWNTGTSYVNEEDADEITALAHMRGIDDGYRLDVRVIGNGLTELKITNH